MLSRGVLVCVGLCFAVGVATATEIQVAVASNFSQVLEILAARFEAATGHRVTLIPGSTAKHYAQIKNGAPFDIFLAADALHAERLEDGDLALPGSRISYAFGELVLWSPTEDYVDDQGQVLATGDFRFLGIANPELAPYGLAAREALESLGLWEGLQDRIVRGENIGQAFQFVASGSAELGLVALSQVTKPGHRMRAGSYWKVPQELYSPIDQQAVLLRDTAAAREFMDFIESAEAQVIIRQNGYTTPRGEAH